jgi:hypothetical protein
MPKIFSAPSMVKDQFEPGGAHLPFALETVTRLAQPRTRFGSIRSDAANQVYPYDVVS